MPALPLEITLQVLQASLQAKDPATQRHFEQLRLVSKHTKRRAHQWFPAGVAALARRAVVHLLDRTPPSKYPDELHYARRILARTTTLVLRCEALPKLELHEGSLWAQGARAILARTKKLEDLHVNCAGDPFAIYELGIEQVANLRELHFDDGWKDQLHGTDLSGMTSLRSFKFYDSDGFSNYDLDGPLQFLLPPQLAILVLDNLDLSGRDIEALNISSMCGLEQLSLNGNELEDADLLAMDLPKLKNLQSLTLSNNALREGFPLLMDCKALTHLDLTGNRISTLARLPPGCAIEQLLLAANLVTDPAALSLDGNKSVRELELDDIPLTSYDFGLASNTTLRRLGLFGSRPSAVLMRQLREQLEHNSTLESLRLQSCSITDEVMSEFWLGEGSGLKDIQLDGNSFGETGIKPLRGSVAKHGLNTKLRLDKHLSV